jgi:hypothetical protein
LAESRAKRKVPMTMEDWAKRLDIFLSADDRDVLQNAGSITAKIAKEYAESEFEIELPSIDEQRRLAEVLWAFDETRQAYKKLLKSTDELVKSQLLCLFY